MGKKKRICLQCRRPGFNPWVRKIPWRRAWQTTPVILPGESHEQRSLGATVCGVIKSQTWLSDWAQHAAPPWKSSEDVGTPRAWSGVPGGTSLDAGGHSQAGILFTPLHIKLPLSCTKLSAKEEILLQGAWWVLPYGHCLYVNSLSELLKPSRHAKF